MPKKTNQNEHEPRFCKLPCWKKIVILVLIGLMVLMTGLSAYLIFCGEIPGEKRNSILTLMGVYYLAMPVMFRALIKTGNTEPSFVNLLLLFEVFGTIFVAAAAFFELFYL